MTFATILAIIRAIPAVKSWYDQLTALYVQAEIARMRHADREAIRKAVFDHDQRELEKQLGNPHPGEASGLPGTHVVDTLPNVDGVSSPK